MTDGLLNVAFSYFRVNSQPSLERKITCMKDLFETITLGGGCFWCTEAVYVQVRGVVDVESGYCNGQSQQPTYAQVCSGTTGCNEVVKLVIYKLN